MSLMMIVIFAIGGAFWIGSVSEDWFTGLSIGALIGWLFARSMKTNSELADARTALLVLQTKLHSLHTLESSNHLATTEASDKNTVDREKIKTATASNIDQTNHLGDKQSQNKESVPNNSTPPTLSAAMSATKFVAPDARPPLMPALPQSERIPPPIPVSQSRMEAAAQVAAPTTNEPAEPRFADESANSESIKQPADEIALSRTHSRRLPVAAENDSVGMRLKRFFTEGNLPAKFGALITLIGVALALKYASDLGMFHMPIEVRLSAIALGAVAALLFAFRKRESHPGFSLAVQGGAIGVLFMTVFASFRIYPLLQQEAAFALLVLLAIACGILAIKQNAFSLALIGLLGGFLAPILISKGGGSHIALFSYYLILNLVIFGISLLRNWRVLNLLGWIFTFGVGTIWGALRYRPEHFNTTEPFLIAFFLIFTLIGLVYAMRSPDSRRGFVDGTLTFATPLVVFLLQAGLLEGDKKIPLAFSALALAAFYILLALFVHTREGMKNLRDSYAALAVMFATIAVPLATSARATAATWAVEGAMLVWLGIRQSHRLQRWSGIVLQLAAGTSFVISMVFNPLRDARFILNGEFFGAVILTVAALFSARCYRRARASDLHVALFYLLGLSFWVFGGMHEIDVRANSHWKIESAFIFASISMLGSAFLANRWRFVLPAVISAGASLLGLIFVALLNSDNNGVLADRAWITWIAFALSSLGSFALIRDQLKTSLPLVHTIWFLTWPLLLSVELDRRLLQTNLGSGWQLACIAMPWLLLFVLNQVQPRVLVQPNSHYIGEFKRWLGGTLSIICAVAIALTLFHDGNARPTMYLPVINPLEISQLLALLLCGIYLRDQGAFNRENQLVRNGLIAIGFVLYSVAVLRAVHHWGQVPWDSNLITRGIAQSALTIAWSVAGVAVMIVAARRANRALWFVGWSLILVVLGKLLLIDRGFIGNLSAIVSFLGVGLLLVAVGYFSPVPPSTEAKEKNV